MEHESQAEPQSSTEEEALALRVLGQPSITVAGRTARLGPRAAEILAALALVGGASLHQLHLLLYGDRSVKPSTLKASISHLRHTLDIDIGSRPYRLPEASWCDAVELIRRVERGDLAGATRLYRGQLLPTSEAPLIVDSRYVLDVTLRTALLTRGSSADLLRYAAVNPSDLAALERAVAVAEAHDPARPIAVGRLAGALRDETQPTRPG